MISSLFLGYEQILQLTLDVERQTQNRSNAAETLLNCIERSLEQNIKTYELYQRAMLAISRYTTNPDHEKKAQLRLGSIQIGMAHLAGKADQKEKYILAAIKSFKTYSKLYHDSKGYYQVACIFFEYPDLSQRVVQRHSIRFRMETDRLVCGYHYLYKAKGYLLADLERSRCLKLGIGTEIDEKKAKKILMKLAKSGSQTAMAEYVKHSCDWLTDRSFSPPTDSNDLETNLVNLSIPELIAYSRIYFELDMQEFFQICLNKAYTKIGSVAEIRAHYRSSREFTIAALNWGLNKCSSASAGCALSAIYMDYVSSTQNVAANIL